MELQHHISITLVCGFMSQILLFQAEQRSRVPQARGRQFWPSCRAQRWSPEWSSRSRGEEAARTCTGCASSARSTLQPNTEKTTALRKPSTESQNQKRELQENTALRMNHSQAEEVPAQSSQQQSRFVMQKHTYRFEQYRLVTLINLG